MTGWRFKCLKTTDPCSKEVSVIVVDVSIGGAQVCRILDRLSTTLLMPYTLVLDNGPGFARMTL